MNDKELNKKLDIIVWIIVAYTIIVVVTNGLMNNVTINAILDTCGAKK